MFLTASHLTKIFDHERGSITALRDFSFELKLGESIAILGPSGCGKSTLLRIISGLEAPTSGELLCEGKDVLKIPAHKRDFVMMSQSPGLFPTMNVYENIGFGLKIRKIPVDLRRKKINEILHLVQMEDFGRRMPDELSGGQQQRVALARALVVRPKLLLLDEPLANLDAPLRAQIRKDFRSLQIEFSLTSIFVTHDEGEAREVSDRVIRFDIDERARA